MPREDSAKALRAAGLAVCAAVRQPARQTQDEGLRKIKEPE